MTTAVPEFQTYDRMRKAIEVADVPIVTMADELGVSRETISRWLNGRTKPSRATLRVWALRTGVPFEWLETGSLLPHLDSNQKPAG